MSEIHIKRLPEIDTIKAMYVMLILIHHCPDFLYPTFITGIFEPYLGRFGLGLFTFVPGYALYKNNAQI